MKRVKSSKLPSDSSQIVLKEIKIDSDTYHAFRSLMLCSGAGPDIMNRLIETMMHNILCIVMTENQDIERKPLSFSEMVPIFSFMFPFTIFQDSSKSVEMPSVSSVVESSMFH